MMHSMVRRLLPISRGLAGNLTKRTIIHASQKEVSRDLIAFIQQEIDLRPIAIKRWKKRTEWDQLVEDHKFNEKRLRALGSDLSTAHFVIVRGGAVRFHGIDQWYEADEDGRVPKEVPNVPADSWRIEAVDASHTPFMYCSFDNFGHLEGLQYLALRGCAHVDDWCLDRLMELNHSLRVLDLSGCPRVTERGLATLHRLSNLRRLIIRDMPNVPHQPLVGMMLEEVMPNCVIEGIDFSAKPSSDDLQDVDINANRDSFEKYEKALFESFTKDRDAGMFNIGKFTF